MRPITKIYLGYLERSVIGMSLSLLVLISASGFAYGDGGRVPAILAAVMLVLIFSVEFGRRRVLLEYPEIKKKPFGEIRLFWFLVQKRTLNLAESITLNTGKQIICLVVSRIMVIVIIAIAISTLWMSFSISANMTLKRRQAIAGAKPGIPATFFNRAIVIEVLQITDDGISSSELTAVIRSEGYPDLRVENVKAGYVTVYNGPNLFSIKVITIQGSVVQFFVEKQ